MIASGALLHQCPKRLPGCKAYRFTHEGGLACHQDVIAALCNDIQPVPPQSQLFHTALADDSVSGGTPKIFNSTVVFAMTSCGGSNNCYHISTKSFCAWLVLRLFAWICMQPFLKLPHRGTRLFSWGESRRADNQEWDTRAIRRRLALFDGGSNLAWY